MGTAQSRLPCTRTCDECEDRGRYYRGRYYDRGNVCHAGQDMVSGMIKITPGSGTGQTDSSSTGWYAVTFATYQKINHESTITVTQIAVITGRGRGVAWACPPGTGMIW